MLARVDGGSALVCSPSLCGVDAARAHAARYVQMHANTLATVEAWPDGPR